MCCPQVRANVVGGRQGEWQLEHPVNWESAAIYLQGRFAGFKEDMSDAEERETVLLALQVGGWDYWPVGWLSARACYSAGAKWGKATQVGKSIALPCCRCAAARRCLHAQLVIQRFPAPHAAAALGERAGGR